MLVNPLTGLGAKCGSIYIDREFKGWLRDDVLGKDYYGYLDPSGTERTMAVGTEGEKMRQVMKAFVECKRAFTGKEDHMTIELPDPLHNLTIDGHVDQGELILTK